MPFVCLLSFLSSQLRLSSVSVVFDFNNSLNDVAPVSPIQFPVDMKIKENSELLIDCFARLSIVFTCEIELCECCV